MYLQLEAIVIAVITHSSQVVMNATEEPKVNEFSFSIHKRWAQSTIETPIGVEVRPGLPNPRLQVADGRPISEVDLARREIVGGTLPFYLDLPDEE